MSRILYCDLTLTLWSTYFIHLCCIQVGITALNNWRKFLKYVQVSKILTVMDPFSVKVKRKLRRTRKCLNEIRKRTNQLRDIATFKCSNNRKYDKKKCDRAPISITTNRLALLNKAIRSETVTRSLLHKQQNKTHYTHMHESKDGEKLALSHKKCDDIISSNFGLGDAKGALKKDKKNEYISPRAATDKESNCNIENSINLFSPLQSDNSDKSDSLKSYLSLSDSSSSALQTDYTNIYEEFMNNIPKYISETAPLLFKTDAIEKNKIIFSNMCLESDNLTDINNTLQCSNAFTSEKRIIQNPIDYIGNSCQQIQSPKSSGSSPAVSLSSPSSPLCSIVHNSPVYSYYPHRLNQ